MVYSFLFRHNDLDYEGIATLQVSTDKQSTLSVQIDDVPLVQQFGAFHSFDFDREKGEFLPNQAADKKKQEFLENIQAGLTILVMDDPGILE
jgi:hypothetical protein